MPENVFISFLVRPKILVIVFIKAIFISDFTDFLGKVFFGLFSVKKSKKSRFLGLVQIE